MTMKQPKPDVTFDLEDLQSLAEDALVGIAQIKYAMFVAETYSDMAYERDAMSMLCDLEDDFIVAVDRLTTLIDEAPTTLIRGVTAKPQPTFEEQS